MAAYRGVLLDLFGTLIEFDRERLPETEIGGIRMRSTMGVLAVPLARSAPGVSVDAFFAALTAVSDEMARARRDDHVELPSRERFRRALARVGVEVGADEAAAHLSRLHMGCIADATVFPPAHAAFLANLHGRYRLGVVSNFDDAATAHEILRRHGITPYLDAVVVSEALGLRKPHPAVPRAGLQGLGLAARDVLFVGDTFAEDVAGAHAAGLDAAWIDRRGEGPPAAGPPARWVVRALPELAAIL